MTLSQHQNISSQMVLQQRINQLIFKIPNQKSLLSNPVVYSLCFKSLCCKWLNVAFSIRKERIWFSASTLSNRIVYKLEMRWKCYHLYNWTNLRLQYWQFKLLKNPNSKWELYSISYYVNHEKANVHNKKCWINQKGFFLSFMIYVKKDSLLSNSNVLALRSYSLAFKKNT